MKPTKLRLDRLETRLAPAVATWDGGGTNANWTTAANWVGDVAPNPGDDLVFPGSATQLTNVNDFPDGTAFHSFKITGSGYHLTGNGIALAAGFSVDVNAFNSSSDNPEIGLPLSLTADQTFANDTGFLRFLLSSSVSLNGHALTVLATSQPNLIVPPSTISGPITGSGSLTFTGTLGTFLTGNCTFTGPTNVSDGLLDVEGTLPGPVTVVSRNGAFTQLAGGGTVGDVTVTSGGLNPGRYSGVFPMPAGILKTGNVSLGPGASTSFALVNDGSVRSLAVTGTVQLGGTVSVVPTQQMPPSSGAQFTLINNDGTDPIVGTFANAPEGGLIQVSPFFQMRITYRGGDGNDVVATVVGGAAYAVGAGAGGFPIVNVYRSDGTLVNSFFAYATTFRGGVRVTTAEVTFDGVPAVITAPGPGSPPLVRIFDGKTFALVREFMAYDPAFTGGVFIAASRIVDSNLGPGAADIITGAGAGGGPHVKVFDGFTGALLSSFFAYDPRFAGGVSVAGTDNFSGGSGIVPGSVITGAGPGGGPHVRVFNGLTGALTNEFFAYDTAFRGGVNVTSHGPLHPAFPNPRIGGGQFPSVGAIVTAPASFGGPEVRLFGPTGQQIGSFLAYDPRFLGGVTVGVQSIDANGTVTLETGAGPGGGPHVKTWQVANGVATLQQSFFAFDPAFTGGIFVG